MFATVCIALIAGTLEVPLPTSALTLGWMHTVEKTPWEEDYRIVQGALILEEARVKGSGAGMDPPAGAKWAGGWWRYTPSLGPLREVTPANSAYAPGYTICWDGACRKLQTMVPIGIPVSIQPRPCYAPSHPSP